MYAFNQLAQRLNLWRDIGQQANRINRLWCIMGDFNNVLSCQDRVGGNPVTTHEFQDLQDMMNRSGLFSHDTTGDHFTWSNRHRQGIIYSRIDHVLCNVDLFTTYPGCVMEIFDAHISDHSPIRLILDIPSVHRKYFFKFLNCLIECPDFMSNVRTCWANSRFTGQAMYVTWRKLHALQSILRTMLGRFSNIPEKVEKAC